MNRECEILKEINELSNEYDVAFEVYDNCLKLSKVNARPQLVYNKKISITEIGATNITLVTYVQEFIDNYNEELLKLVIS